MTWRESATLASRVGWYGGTAAASADIARTTPRPPRTAPSTIPAASNLRIVDGRYRSPVEGAAPGDFCSAVPAVAEGPGHDHLVAAAPGRVDGQRPAEPGRLGLGEGQARADLRGADRTAGAEVLQGDRDPALAGGGGGQHGLDPYPAA